METLSSNPLNVTSSGSAPLQFRYFPVFAKFIKDHHIVPYVQEQIRLSREADLPLLKLLGGMTDEQMIELGLPNHIEFLTAVENNMLAAHIEKTLRSWENDAMVVLGRNDISAEDIIIGGQIRKKAFLKFLPFYTTDITEALTIVDEIDTFTATSTAMSTNMYIKILNVRINDHAHFIESIASTSPGAIFIFDVVENKAVYYNEKLMQILGYDIDVSEVNTTFLSSIVHPDDKTRIAEAEKAILHLKQGEIHTLDCRVAHKDGHYIWLRNHISVFKRTGEDLPSQIISIAFDIQKEREAEARLTQSEEQLLEAQELAGMGSYVWNSETDELIATPFLDEIFGSKNNASAQVVVGVHPADIERVLSTRAKALDSMGIYDVEYRYLLNGKEKILWSRGAVFLQNGQKLIRGTVMDITERKHIIQTLQRNEGLYKQAQAMSHIGNWTWDLLLDRLSWSDELYNIYGLRPGTELNLPFLKTMHSPDDIKMMNGFLDNALKTLEPFDYYYHLLTSDGKQKILHATGNVWADANSKPYKLTGTVQDVTERQTLIEDLQKSDERYKQAQAMSHIGNWEWYITENKIVWTDELYRIYGLDPSQGPITYERYISLQHPDEKDMIQEAIRNSLENNSPYEISHRIILGTGEIKHLHGIGDVVRDENGNAIKMFGTAQDITAQKESEMILNQKNIELSHSNASLEEFAYVASHDLKEPLRKISTFGDLMLSTDNERLSSEGKNYLDKIISSSKRMQTMINDLMSLSIISGNKSFEPYDINELIAEVLGVLEYTIREKNAVINVDVMPTLNIVPSQFRQLFQNLLSNSLKFSKPDAPPVISIRSEQLTMSQAAVYGLTERRKYVKIEFTDNGIGFENEYANKIFTIFQRLHGKSAYEGNGIGLSICRKVVENHKGTILAKGSPGEGAVFTLIIPS